jgi:DNA-directed RNA polymerase specialized sigma24 family protein
VLAAMQAWQIAMTGAQTGERTTQAEFEAFYQRTARTLHGYLSRLSSDPATAEEILQETYIRMLNVPAMDEVSRRAYLYKIATNLLRDRWRKFKREKKWWKLNAVTEHVHQNFNLPVDMASVFDALSVQERAYPVAGARRGVEPPGNRRGPGREGEKCAGHGFSRARKSQILAGKSRIQGGP